MARERLDAAKKHVSSEADEQILPRIKRMNADREKKNLHHGGTETRRRQEIAVIADIARDRRNRKSKTFTTRTRRNTEAYHGLIRMKTDQL